MKRTMEEMIEHIKENHLEVAMVTIAMNNDKGFAFVPVEIINVYKRDGKYFVFITGYGEEAIEPIEGINMDRLSHHLNRLSAIVTIHNNDTENEQYELLIAHGDNEDDANEKIQYMLYQDMLEYMKINTFGKLNAMIDKASDIQKNFTDVMIKKYAFQKKLEYR